MAADIHTKDITEHPKWEAAIKMLNIISSGNDEAIIEHIKWHCSRKENMTQETHESNAEGIER